MNESSVKKYSSLCLSGGGIAGFVHVGVLDAFAEIGSLDTIDTYVCTSIGSVIGTLLAVGLTPDDIWENLSVVTHDVLQYADIDKFFDTFGMDSGEYFMAEMIDILMRFKVSPTITLAQVKELYGKRVIITATNVSKLETTYFTPETHGDMRVTDAIRISISIPFLFSAVKIDGDIYADGGIMDNYPIQYCIYDFLERNKQVQKEEVDKYILGSFIDSMNPKTIANIEDYTFNVFACCLKRTFAYRSNDKCTIYVQLQKTSAVDFDIGLDKRKQMRQIGYTAAKSHLKESQDSQDA